MYLEGWSDTDQPWRLFSENDRVGGAGFCRRPIACATGPLHAVQISSFSCQYTCRWRHSFRRHVLPASKPCFQPLHGLERSLSLPSRSSRGRCGPTVTPPRGGRPSVGGRSYGRSREVASSPKIRARMARQVPGNDAGHQTHAKIAFRHLDPEAREEAIQEVVCNACCAFARLVELGKTDLAYPSPLARYGVAQAKDGRKVGGHLNCKDVLSDHCQRRKHLIIERLDKFDREAEAWEEILVEDKHAGPADVAVSRIDFAAWLRTLPSRLRQDRKGPGDGGDHEGGGKGVSRLPRPNLAAPQRAASRVAPLPGQRGR